MKLSPILSTLLLTTVAGNLRGPSIVFKDEKTPDISERDLAPASCFRFEPPSPPLGTNLPVGFVLNNPLFSIFIEQFQYSTGGFAGVFEDVNAVVSNNAGGNNGPRIQELMLDNVRFRIKFPNGVKRVQFRYADRGGNVNFEVDGDYRNQPDMWPLNGTPVGGHLIQINPDPSTSYEDGRIKILSNLSSGDKIFNVMIGGQEFFIDDLCFFF